MAWAVADRHEDSRRESISFRRPVPARGVGRRMETLFRAVLALVILWTAATVLWVIDPAFLLHLHALLTDLFSAPQA